MLYRIILTEFKKINEAIEDLADSLVFDPIDIASYDTDHEIILKVADTGILGDNLDCFYIKRNSDDYDSIEVWEENNGAVILLERD